MTSLDEMKRRILKSYKYKEDLVDPLSEVLDLEEGEVVDFIIDRMDMLRLQGLHPRYENRRENISRDTLEGKVERDLHLPLLSDCLSILDEQEKQKIRGEIVEEAESEGKEYETALKEGKERLREIVGEKI